MKKNKEKKLLIWLILGVLIASFAVVFGAMSFAGGTKTVKIVFYSDKNGNGRKDRNEKVDKKIKIQKIEYTKNGNAVKKTINFNGSNSQSVILEPGKYQFRAVSADSYCNPTARTKTISIKSNRTIYWGCSVPGSSNPAVLPPVL